MEISNFRIQLNSDEFCDFILTLLRTKLSTAAKFHQVQVLRNQITVSGDETVLWLFCCEFTIRLSVSVDADGQAIMVQLVDAEIKNWPFGSLWTANTVLSHAVGTKPGISYSAQERILRIVPAKLIAPLGLSFTSRVALDFSNGLAFSVE